MDMKRTLKRTRVLAGAGIGGLLLIITVYASVVGRRPFVDLDASEIALATVRLIPPDKTVEIADTESLEEYLKDVVIYRRDSSHSQYAGQYVNFTLTMKDGARTEVAAYNPFLIIDGVGYRTKYEPCEALNQYANDLLNAEDAHIILEEPPWLAIVSGDTSVGAMLGSYSWQRRNHDGTIEGISVCGVHPLDCQDRLYPYTDSGPTVTLRFHEEPDEILSIRCWSDEHWGDIAADSEDVMARGYEIELRPGGYIYEVVAKWNAENGYGGTANYYFYVRK